MSRLNRPLSVGWVAAALTACSADVRIVGAVQRAPDDPSPLASVGVEVRDGAFELLLQDTTDSAGRFSVTAPRGEEIHLVVDGDRPVSFRGESGLNDEFDVPDGTLFGVPDAWLDDFRAPFEGCPDAGEGDGMVLGRTALDLDVDPGVPRRAEPCSFAFVEKGDVRVEACYLAEVEDEPGTFAYDPEARLVGASGRFLIPGVSGGPWRMVVGRSIGCDPERADGTLPGESTIHIPDGGVVARLPALVPL